MNRRILIVDDNPTNRRLAASVLALEGYAVDQAQDAEHAQAYLASIVPDLILMDIALPGMDGLSLTRRIKSDPRLRDIPVVALTAFAMKGDEQKARDAGCVGYLTKPIDTREFAHQVAEFFIAAPMAPILIVDDRPANLRLLRAQLEAEGERVIEAANGVEALEQLAVHPVRGVISDILMPRMDGYRLCMEVRKHPQLAQLPLVLYTSTYDSPADRSLAHAAGADAYISKPAPVASLLAALRDAAERERGPFVPVAELQDPVLKQYSESLIRKLEEKSAQLGEACEGLAQTEARLSGLVESAMDAIVALDESQTIVIFNAAAERMFGCKREQAMGASIDQFIPARFQQTHKTHVEQFGDGSSRQGRRMGARAVWAQRLDGTEFPVEASISRLGTSNGWLFTVFLRDITERKRAEAALEQSEQQLRRLNRVLSVLSGINNLIVRASDRDELLSQSCRIAVEDGAFPLAWVGLVDPADARLHFVVGHGDDPAYFRQLAARLQDPDAARDTPWSHALRELLPVVINDVQAASVAQQAALATRSRGVAALPLSIDARAVGVLVIHAAEPGFFDSKEMDLLDELASDIAFALDHLGKADRIRFLANYDPLTGLPNRSQFTEYLNRAVKASDGDDTMLLVVLLLDLERFRRVNQTRGRAVGDELLRQVGARLGEFNDSAARFGDDVFALTLRTPRTAAEVARAYIDLAEHCFGTAYSVAGKPLRIGCRAGIAVYPSDGDDADGLLHNAEAALRRARASSEPFVFYAPELNARAAEALSLESKLRGAIDRSEFVLHYQPKVAIADRRITGLEALIRWRDPDQATLVPPDQFIPVLEESGLIGAVGQWALAQALADQAEWTAQGLPSPRVAVNVSPLQLRRLDFAAAIVQLVGGRPSAELELEITESVIMDDVERNIAALTEVRGVGVTVSIDDFGTGYCSLSYVAKLPVTSLKIDRSFVVGMTSGPEGLAIVSSIIALAHALRLTVVAEGVETEEQARLLRLLGCDEAQGFLFFRPVPASEIVGLLRRQPPHALH